jgi:uncharacterized membrane-anchored protein YitT (DUF2179 family)
MNPIWNQIIIQTVLRHKEKKPGIKRDYSAFDIAKGYVELRVMAGAFLRDVCLIGLGIACAAFGLESFLLPSQFIDGGATGISLLITEVTKIPLYVLLILINIPFLFLGLNVISKQFAAKATLAIIGLALTIATIHFPEVTTDKLLVAVFGGFFLGAGIGLSIRGGAVLDGTEGQCWTERKFSLFT